MLLEKKIPFSYILNKVKYDLLYVTVIGLTVHFLTSFFRDFIPNMPLAIPAFLGTAISVILSFKLNQSYDRWWEARKIWGSIVNDSRTLVLQLQSFVNSSEKEVVKKIAYRQMAWNYSLGQSLRGLNPLENTARFLSATEIEQVDKHTNKPLAILQLNNADISHLHRNNHLDTYSKIQLDSTLVRLCDSMGRAERINNTVFPSTYRLFLHFAIYFFAITLSMALLDMKIYFEMPLLILTSLFFFLLEKSAFHMQDPFKNRPSDTPVTTIAQTIEINIRQLLGETELPQPLKTDKFYAL